MGLRLVKRTHFEDYAKTFESKGDFPILISKIVRATCLPSVRVDFASGNAVFVGGWDGIVYSHDDRGIVPIGISLWELGTSDPRPKAESDYVKRTADPKGYDPKETTLVIVTARFWEHKEDWRREKLKEGIWNDIRVYDSSDLEQWIDQTQAVSLWFAVNLGIFPFDGLFDAALFWEEYSIGPRGTLHPKVITSGREDQMKKIQEFLLGPASIIGIKASTKNEAIAFIVASALQFINDEKELFFSKSLIVDNEGNYRGIRINSITPLNLIPRFENFQPLYVAVGAGHHVLVPLGGDDSFNNLTIELPTIYKEGQIDGLVNMGLSQEEAEKYSRESGRNITILKRMLEFPDTKSTWLKNLDTREILPALLMGRWNESNDGDRKILENLSGMPYDDYSAIVRKWKDVEESPLIQIGQTWRLTSPLDLWSSLSTDLNESDFLNLAQSFHKVFELEEDEKELTSSDDFTFRTRQPRYSSWAKEGLVQSLILISVYGDSLKMPEMKSPKEWVDNLVLSLLNNASAEQWIAFDQKLPLITEASPESFICALNNALKIEDTPILKMFTTKKGFISDFGSHTGLLWALESIAWLAEHLHDATVLLLKLAAIDPDKDSNHSNRPANSLKEIYKAWHPQTLADTETRMTILANAIKVEPNEGWKLLLSMTPKTHDHAMPTHKMRWRLFNAEVSNKYDVKEIYAVYSKLTDLLITQYDNSADKFSSLASTSINFGPIENDKLLSFLEEVIVNLKSKDEKARNVIRKILSHHRKYPDANWSAPEDILLRYEKLYKLLEPQDLIEKHKWLFDDYHIEFPDDKYKEDEVDEGDEKYKYHIERVREIRTEAVKELLAALNLERTLDLADQVKNPASLGESLSYIIDDYAEMFRIWDTFKTGKANLDLIQTFIRFKFYEKGQDWIFNFYNQAQGLKYDNKALINILLPLPHSNDLWDFIENKGEIIESEYWLKVQANFYHVSQEEKVRGIKMLIKHKRFFSAVDFTYMMKNEIPTEIIIDLLQKAATEEASEKTQLREYEISTLFEDLGMRKDTTEEIIAKLEWLYLPVIGSYGTTYNPVHLHNELAKNPDFFVQVLKWVYVPIDESKKEDERKDISNETIQTYAMQGYRLMNNWKTIPGVDEDGNVDEDFLNTWIDKVRELAQDADRLGVADGKIGYILAQYPETNKDYWPPDAISNAIERINTHDLNLNFSIGITNKRGFTSRGPYDGGIIERANAEHFSKLAQVHKFKHPIVSKILNDIATRYLEDAKREDEDAERARLEY